MFRAVAPSRRPATTSESGRAPSVYALKVPLLYSTTRLLPRVVNKPLAFNQSRCLFHAHFAWDGESTLETLLPDTKVIHLPVRPAPLYATVVLGMIETRDYI